MASEKEADYTPFMREALELAERGRYTACPNPTVGAVLVRDGRCAALGFHRAAGQAHAETACLKDAVTKNVPTVGATLVVTLEPCNHHGKMPPCVKAILEAGIARVVIGARDPNPIAAGGVEALRAAGVEDGCIAEGFASPAAAFAAARAQVGEDDRIVVFGSFLTVADVLIK